MPSNLSDDKLVLSINISGAGKHIILGVFEKHFVGITTTTTTIFMISAISAITTNPDFALFRLYYRISTSEVFNIKISDALLDKPPVKVSKS